MLTLGHIVYSNCFPVHAGIITRNIPFQFRIVEGIPTELNRMLFDGRVDVSPSSSIEYALNAGRYLIMPDLSITSRKRAMSIILESRLPIPELDKKTVALTSASATSVVLLRLLLELKHGVHPDFIFFKQGAEDPSGGADAALTIGDLALKRSAASAYPHVYDLGSLWSEFTGLPFVFALWQVNYKKSVEKDLRSLYDILIRSREYGLAHLRELSEEHEGRFGIGAGLLYDYWKSLSYSLGEDEKKGLQTFYGYAAELGVIKTVPELRFLD